MSQSRRIALYFDPPTHHFLRDRLFDVSYAGHAGDQILAPYAHMKEFLNSKAIEVHTADYIPAKPDDVVKLYVSSSGNPSNCKRFAKRADVILSAFFALECPTVEPFMYKELKHSQHYFKRVYSWSDSASLEPFVGGPLGCLPMRWPQSFDSVHEEIWNQRNRKFLVLINGNKLPRYSSPCRELYSERMRAIEYFARTGDIDLYGHGWDGPTYIIGRIFVPGTFGRMPLPGTVQRINRALVTGWQRLRPDPRLLAARKAYRGFAASKAATLGKYTFALCFENSILKGWTTEKIFDCFFAGTVPIYWGAPDIEGYIPRECFIDMRRFSGYPELREYLKSLNQHQIETFRESAREFLNSPRFKPFTKHSFAELFAAMIEEDAAIRLGELAAASA